MQISSGSDVSRSTDARENDAPNEPAWTQEPELSMRVGPHLRVSEVLDVLALAQVAAEHDGVQPFNEVTELALRLALTTAPTQAHPIIRPNLSEGADQPVGAPGPATGVASEPPQAGGRDTQHLILWEPAPANQPNQQVAVVAYAQMMGAQAGSPHIEVVVHPAHRRKGHATRLVRAALETADLLKPVGTESEPLAGWSHGNLPAAQGFAEAFGAKNVRELHRMTRRLGGQDDLPVLELPAGLIVRTFRPGHDDQAWLEANTAAFVHHPEQGKWSLADLRARQREPWFDPDGLLLAEDKITGEILGFHWTKQDGNDGEVYVVGVTPGAQGRGLGRVLTVAGLMHLRECGVDLVHLYVESDNTPAQSTYKKLGFKLDTVDVMYRLG